MISLTLVKLRKQHK